jgi:thiamine-monophosphate kinase
VALGQALRGVASSAIDVSDGLLGDLSHILRRSNVGATLNVDAVSRGAVLSRQPQALQRECTLAGGDDYELVFTAPPRSASAVDVAARLAGLLVTRIGAIEVGKGLRLIDTQGRPVANTFGSFDHFKT